MRNNYTGAIIDSIMYINNRIREKADLQNDGISLVGAAFGGNEPKIKLNKLQTESEHNVQKGVEQILRGIIQGIRNPRSHEKFDDSLEHANSIILFISYLNKF